MGTPQHTAAVSWTGGRLAVVVVAAVLAVVGVRPVAAAAGERADGCDVHDEATKRRTVQQSDCTPADIESDGGILWTAAEVGKWRERARRGPYKSRGDTGVVGSPGDWDRITTNTKRFLADPDQLRVTNPASGCTVKPSLQKQSGRSETEPVNGLLPVMFRFSAEVRSGSTGC